MKHYSLGIIALALAVFGAGCGKQPVTTTTNTKTENTNTTGTFSTNENANTGSTNSSTNSNPTSATVTLTASGVSTTSLTVASGTVVTFVNSDSAVHRIASNPHPTHTDLPGLDLTIPAGSSRSFTFTKVGTWGYHDHEDPFATEYHGVIVVQ